jgi:hypothetical protein
MEQIKVTTLRKAMTLLDACGFQYAIIDSDGAKYGVLELTEQKPPSKRAALAFPYGMVIAWIRKHTPENFPVGEVCEIPYGNYGKERIRSSALNLLSRKYGNNKFTSIIDGENVQIMRVEE